MIICCYLLCIGVGKKMTWVEIIDENTLFQISQILYDLFFNWIDIAFSLFIESFKLSSLPCILINFYGFLQKKWKLNKFFLPNLNVIISRHLISLWVLLAQSFSLAFGFERKNRFNTNAMHSCAWNWFNQ